MTEIDITRRMAGRVSHLPTGTLHRLNVKTRYECQMVEVEDVNFHHDSAVLLPDYGTSAAQEGTTPEQERVAGLAVLYACYRHAREHPDQSALVVGHTDRSGRPGYNQRLSEQRAQDILAVLKGDRDEWVRIALAKSKVEDYQQILIWLTYQAGWDCDPGPKTNERNAQTRQAVRDFQQQYNDDERFPDDILVDGKVGRQTWGAFFDVYMQELMYALGTDEAGLLEAQQSMRFMECEAIGCGEEFPITEDRAENHRTPIDRRVEILFFDPGEEPVVDCRRPRGACVELYELHMYCVTPIPVDPLPLPSGVAVHVMLQLKYEDPDGNERRLPEGLPVIVEYTNGDPETVTVREDGVLDFFARREKQSFTLRFQFEESHYVATSGTESGPDDLISEGEVAGYVNRAFRVFQLPLDWRLADSDWTVTGAPAGTFDESDSHFKNLEDDSIDNIGSAATPVQMLLEPHWLYIKLLYFDRWLMEKLSIPPVMVEGLREVSASGGTPDTRSNWTTDPEACQCLPWILQDPAKPDADVLVQFRSAPDTYIESTGTSSSPSRRLVTKTESTGGAAADPGLNEGDGLDFDFDTPSANRLKYYDLPSVWKSRTYYAQLSGGSGSPAADSGLFEDVITDSTTDAQPMLISLDDLVLFEGDASGGLIRPLEWNSDPASPLSSGGHDHEDRVAIFCNTFDEDYATGTAGGTDLSSCGLYKPDSQSSFVSQKVQMTAARTDHIGYVADYPDWPRAVICRGSLFDAFDRRTPDSDTGVVGARAAVRWLDATSSGASFVSPGTDRSGAPDPVRSSFCTYQAMYEQRHPRWWRPDDYDDRGIGRYDMALLRCCDVDNDEEVAVNLHYFRFHFDYSFTPSDEEAVHYEASNLTGADARRYEDMVCKNIAARWNGKPETRHTYASAESTTITGTVAVTPQPTRHGALLVPADAAHSVKVRVVWFAQTVRRPMAHFSLRVFKSFRSSMGSNDGEGNMALKKQHASPNRSFTGAHECGHGGSLGDEYIEKGRSASYYKHGLYSFSEGAPYAADVRAMMRGNRFLRPRCFWHAAEWLRLVSGQGFKVQHEHNNSTVYTYSIPSHPRASEGFNYTNWIMGSRKRDVERGERGKFDVFFYPLGSEYTSDRLLVQGHAIGGIVVVVVKMRFEFHNNREPLITGTLNQIDGAIGNVYNKRPAGSRGRWAIRGTLDGYTFGSAGHPPAYLFFSPRYLVLNYPDHASDAAFRTRYDKSMGVSDEDGYEDKIDDVLSKAGGFHFDVETQASGSDEWDDTVLGDIVGDKNDLTFTTSPATTRGPRFVPFFANMLGIDDGSYNNAASFQPIVREVIPGAEVFPFT